MFAFQLALTLVACGGGGTEAPAPAPEPEAAKEAAPEPAAEPDAAEPAAAEVTLEVNQQNCFGNADCTVVELGCCCGENAVAVNKGSAEAVTKKFKADEASCASKECPEDCAAPEAVCQQAKCAIKE